MGSHFIKPTWVNSILRVVNTGAGSVSLRKKATSFKPLMAKPGKFTRPGAMCLQLTGECLILGFALAYYYIMSSGDNSSSLIFFPGDQEDFDDARELGRIGGRLPKLTAHQRAEAIRMVNSGEKTAAEVARLFHVHRSSISRLIAKNVLETGGL